MISGVIYGPTSNVCDDEFCDDDISGLSWTSIQLCICDDNISDDDIRGHSWTNIRLWYVKTMSGMMISGIIHGPASDSDLWWGPTSNSASVIMTMSVMMISGVIHGPTLDSASAMKMSVMMISWVIPGPASNSDLWWQCLWWWHLGSFWCVVDHWWKWVWNSLINPWH